MKDMTFGSARLALTGMVVFAIAAALPLAAEVIDDPTDP